MQRIMMIDDGRTEDFAQLMQDVKKEAESHGISIENIDLSIALSLEGDSDKIKAFQHDLDAKGLLVRLLIP